MTNRKLLNELEKMRQRVHELEALKTKYEQADRATLMAQERLKHLLSSSPGVIYTCKPSGDYGSTFISENVTTQLGYEAREFIEDSRFWADRVHPEDRPHVFAELSRLFEQGHHTHEYRFLHKDGTYRWMHDELKLIRDAVGNPLEIVGFWIDITDRKKMEEALRESEERYRTIFETTGTAIAIIEEDTTISMVNAEFEKLSGYTKKEVEGKKYWPEFAAEEYLERMKEYHRLRRVDPDAAPKSYEFRLIDKGGQFKDIFITVAMIPGTSKSVASLLEITERKQAEDALRESEEKLHILSSHLLTVQEAERKRISTDLHDELGQTLIALKLQLRSIHRKLRKDQRILREECESAQKYIDQIIENIRRLSRDLIPSVLEELGLTAAIQKLIQDFAKYHKIKTSVNIEKVEHFLPKKAQLVTYRVFQEALANIGKHAQASHVGVVINKKNDLISFLIEDDGRGFDVKQVMMQKSIKKGLGLAAMEERIRILGGFLDIRSGKRKGTKISFNVPAREEGN